MVEAPDYIPKWSTEGRASNLAGLAAQCLELAEEVIDNPRDREHARVKVAAYRAAIEEEMQCLIKLL